MTKGTSASASSPAKRTEFEKLTIHERCRLVHVRLCERDFERGFWLHHAESDRWLHWSEGFGYWLPTLHGPMFWREDYWWWDDDILETDDLSVEAASKLFPGSIPVVAKVDQRMEAKRRKIRRDKAKANTDVQLFDKPFQIPKGYGFADDGSRRTYQHNLEPSSHAIGRVRFDEGPAYFASYWLAGQDPLTRISSDGRRFLDKNEAQQWVIAQLRKLEKANRTQELSDRN